MNDMLPSRLRRTDFQRLAEFRVQDAQILLKAGRFAGAYYLGGYAVDCALKAAIARRFRESDFPDRGFVGQIYTHDLEQLLRLSELEREFSKARKANPKLAVNWAFIKDWSEAKRYESQVNEKEAHDLLDAIADDEAGILPWIRKHW